MVTLILFGLAGVGLVAKAVYDVWSGIRMRRVGLRASGMVVGHDRVDVEGGAQFKAVVHFTDDSGRSREFRAYGSHSRPHPVEGVAVPVVYLPDDSRSPQIGLSLYNLPEVLGLLWVGGLFIAATIFFAIVGPNNQ